MFSDEGLGYPFVILSILVSYVLGCIITLIKPGYVEAFSMPFQIMKSFFWKAINRIMKLIGIDDKHKLFALDMKYMMEPFPYLDWFFEKHIMNLPSEVGAFYLDLRNRRFQNEIAQMRGLGFISFAKRYISENSANLREDVYFAEGLVRFLNGMFYSIICSLFIIMNNAEALTSLNYPVELISSSYIFILLVVLVRYKNVRRFEAAAILESYYLVYARIEGRIAKKESHASAQIPPHRNTDGHAS